MKRRITLILSLLLIVAQVFGAMGIVRAEETDVDFFATMLGLDDLKEVSFPDDELKEAVQKELNNIPGNHHNFLDSDTQMPSLWAESLKAITTLTAPEAGISDLTGIESLVNLEYLLLDDNQIVDVTPLAGLANLRLLSLCRNQIVDASPLDGLIAAGCRVLLDGNPIAAPAPSPTTGSNILMSDPYYDDLFGDNTSDDKNTVLRTNLHRNQIKTIAFVDTLEDIPQNHWDVSDTRDGSVLAWSVQNGDLYDLFIGANGKVYGNPDCAGLFEGYFRLEAVHFNDSFDTGSVRDMSRMFDSCLSLQTLNLSSFDTSGVTDMSRMFDSCYLLQALNLSSFDTSGVTDMSRMFAACQSLQTLDLSSFHTRMVMDMSWMFAGCCSLQTVNVSSFDTSSVVNMSRMFYSCQSLQALDVSGFDTSSVTDMYIMFYDCDSLQQLDVSGFDMSNVTDDDGMFEGSSSLKM